LYVTNIVVFIDCHILYVTDLSLQTVDIKLDYCKIFDYCFEKGKSSNVKIAMFGCRLHEY